MRERTIETDGRKLLLEAFKLAGIGKCVDDIDDDDDDNNNNFYLFTCWSQWPLAN
jgi:hypothetical protein